MKRTLMYLAAVLACVAAVTVAQTVTAAPTSSAGSTDHAPRRTLGTRAPLATDYGSGIWGGPVSAVSRTGDPATANVLLMGDSIGNRCTTDIRSALAAKGLTLATITQSGQNTAGLVSLLQAEPAVSHRIIMEAGTNDVFDPFAMPGMTAATLTWASDHGVEIFWADTYVGRAATLDDDLRNSGQVNMAISSAVSTANRIKWVDALTAAVGRGRALSYYVQDGVHPWADAGTGHGDGCAFYAAGVAAVL